MEDRGTHTMDKFDMPDAEGPHPDDTIEVSDTKVAEPGPRFGHTDGTLHAYQRLSLPTYADSLL